MFSHVVANAINIFITFPYKDKEKLKVELISFCSECDVALLEITNYDSSHIIKLGNSDIVEKGQESYALGYPLGTNNLKITKGSISGYQDHFFQTDTTINSGNSGGF